MNQCSKFVGLENEWWLENDGCLRAPDRVELLRRAKLYRGRVSGVPRLCSVCKGGAVFCSWETFRNAIEDHLAGRVMHYDMHGAR